MIEIKDIKVMGIKYNFRGKIVYVYQILAVGRGARLFLCDAPKDKEEIKYTDILPGSVRQSEFIKDATIFHD